MTGSNLTDYYGSGTHFRGADMLKFFLMPFFIFIYLGFPTPIGGYVRFFSNFAPLAIFILCGFFVLVPDAERREEKILVSLKRSAIFFGVLFVAYVILNLAYLSYNYDPAYWMPEIFRKRILFNFLVFNQFPREFPIGQGIWCVFSLVCAYLFFFLAEKIKLMKFSLVLLICFGVIALLTGEFAAFVGFPYFGYYYVPSCTVTVAIPGMLIGMQIRKYGSKLLTRPKWLYGILFVAGVALAYGEGELLSRLGKLRNYSSLIGFWIMAIAVCCFALSLSQIRSNFFSVHGKSYASRFYVIWEPITLLLTILFTVFSPKNALRYLIEYRSIIVCVVCFLIALLISLIKRAIFMQRKFDEE